MRELIALDLPAGPAFLQALISVWEDGDAAVPLDPNAPPAHNAAMLDSMRPAAVLDAQGERHKLPGSLPVEDGDALVVLTSGTTGEPKGAVHTHRGIEYAAFCSSTAAGVIANSCWLACLPLSHVGGLSVVTRAVLTGTELQMLERADPKAIAEAQRQGATHVSLVPAILGRIDPEPFHSILLGGSAIPIDRPSNTIATYGMTESFGGVVYEGLALNGVEMRTTPDGLIELRSPTMLRSYRDGSNPLDAQGWLRTGDLGQIDSATGTLTVLGRVDEVIVTGGEKVWPHTVEAVLLQHDAVSEVAVIGIADPEWGQRVVALVVPMPGQLPLSLQAARELVRNQLPVASAPKEIRLVDSLPRTSVGKLRRMTLTEQHFSGER